MRAVQLTDWGQAPVVRDIDDPLPTGAELLLDVTAAGLCLSDIHVMNTADGVFDYPLPQTLGHEVAGTVAGVGPDADPVWIGQSVVVHGIWSCGYCRNCHRGRQNYCLRLNRQPDGRLPRIGNGLGYPGGLAERMLVPSESVLVATGDLDPMLAAPLADAGLTAYHALRTNRDLIDGSAVVMVIGIGGLGHMAVQILRALGAGTIIAIDQRESARALAITLGAASAHASVDDALDEILGLGGADLVVDFAGAPATVEPATGTLGPGGRIVIVGTAGGRLTVGKDIGLTSGWQVNAPFWGTREDLAAVVALARDGHLDAETVPVGLDDVPEAYRRLHRGDLIGRAVMVPHQ
ncbi:NAD(P)-dependent alcohol dehydrogenase [Gordonia sp. OPL2]|uniref:NAD(P)-dependent alcohol dehydrogenase n=1 Tax=Gordonia sp. OPL2 TaxID=2486274 RepID=UPI0016568057|nr:NAD(P)-dependent alcohol dehydrogenase [Gordonia sp. OPL2]ROZ99053.1 NAD(P)-dependent alcohol dehydrogenase [Gordonia sp. OPL2]